MIINNDCNYLPLNIISGPFEQKAISKCDPACRLQVSCLWGSGGQQMVEWVRADELPDWWQMSLAECKKKKKSPTCISEGLI